MGNQVEEIKQKNNIVQVVGELVELKKAGRHYKGLCPFHGEKTPSFIVNEELQIYKCFGCGVGGDVINFLMELEGLEFGEALEKLANRVGVTLSTEWKKSSGKALYYEINNLAAEYYHYILTKHPAGEPGRKYAKQRGLDTKLINNFRIGFALPEWDGLTNYLVKKKKYSVEVLEKLGLTIKSQRGGYDRFRGRLMFPIIDVAGRVIAFAGRVLPEFAKEGEGKYINSPESEIYHKGGTLFGLQAARAAIKKKNQAVVVEGDLDMISSFSSGVTETVAIKGTALTSEMMTILSRLCNKVVLALDNDSAGELAMKRSVGEAERFDLSIKVVDISDGKDPDEISRKNPKLWRTMIEKAVPVYEFFFDRSIKKYGLDSVEAISAVVKEVVPYLAKIDNQVIKEIWIKKLAEKLGVSKETVLAEVNKKDVVKTQNEEVVERTTDSNIYVLAVLLGTKISLRKEVKKMLLGMPLHSAVSKAIGMVISIEQEQSIESLIKKADSELQEVLKEAYLLEVEELDEKEVWRLIKEWVRRTLREERKRISQEMKVAEVEGNQIKLDNLASELVKFNAVEKQFALI